MLLRFLSKNFSKKTKDYYKILNLPKNASDNQIKNAYVKFTFDTQFA